MSSPLPSLRRYFGTQVGEIKEWPQLRWFGVFLAINLIQSSFNWGKNGTYLTLSDPNSAPICWPFFESCYLLRPLPEFIGPTILILCAVFAAYAIAFLITKRAKFGYWFLFAAFISKTAYYVLDWRYMGNYHYMPNWVLFAFFFLPGKVRLIPILTCLFYVAAGLLKTNVEWVSGNALTRNPPITGVFLEIACAYVLLLEFVIVFGCLSRRRILFWGSLAQLALFHLISYQQVRYYYPLTMAALLSIFPLNWYFSRTPMPAEGSRFSIPVVSWAFLALFVIAQVPQFIFTSDAAVTGDGRTFSLNMLDAHTTCDIYYLARYKGNDIRELRPRETTYVPSGIRGYCDPLVFLNIGRHFCRRLKSDTNFIDLDFYLMSKRYSDPKGRALVRQTDLCEKNPDYYLIKRNSWIADEASG